jgi:predicted TIM-barrel fold metal-dependent hydrolase
MPQPLPDGIVDPHIHQWDPFTTPRSVSREARLLHRLPRIPRWFARLQPRAKGQFIGDPHHVLKPYLPRDYRQDAGSVPVSSVVHIESETWVTASHADFVDETRWVAGLPWQVDGAPALAGIVVHADPRWPDVAAVLDAHLAASDLVRGVRYPAAHHPDRAVMSFTEGMHLLSEPDFLRGFAAVAERQLTFDLWIYNYQLPDAVILAEEYPDTTFVLDHYGTPVGIFGPRGRGVGHTAQQRAGLLARWRDDVAALAALPNVVAKHSGLGMPVLGGVPARPVDAGATAPLVDRCAPLIQHVQDVFGPQRTMWASNYAIDKPVQTIPASIETLTAVLGDATDLSLLLRDVARRTYRL